MASLVYNRSSLNLTVRHSFVDKCRCQICNEWCWSPASVGVPPLWSQCTAIANMEASAAFPRPSTHRKMNLQNEYSFAPENTRAMQSPVLQGGCVDRLVVRRKQRIVSVVLREVYWISSARNYVELHLRDEVLKSRSTLSKVAALVPAGRFLRISRRTIVNLEFVEVAKINSNGTIRIWVSGGTELSASRRYNACVRDVLKTFRKLPRLHT